MTTVGLRAIGTALAVGVIASSVAVATPASAAEALPEVGRCVKVETGTGTYEGAKCVTVDTSGHGKYDFEPLVSAPVGGPTFAVAGGPVTLATTGLPTIGCTSSSISGEYTGPKSSTEKAVFSGCTIEAGGGVSGQPCQSGAVSEQIEIASAEGEIGFIKNQLPKVSVGLDLRPHSPATTLFTAVCSPGTTKTEAITVEGSVIAQIKPVDTMTSSVSLLYKVTKSGHQVPEKFETGLKDTLTTTFSGLAGSFSSPSTLAIIGLSGTSSTPLEIKAKP